MKVYRNIFRNDIAPGVDGLQSDSDIMLDQTRTIDNRRIARELLTVLTEQEISEVETYWRLVLGL